jgi:hypothetical protein
MESLFVIVRLPLFLLALFTVSCFWLSLFFILLVFGLLLTPLITVFCAVTNNIPGLQSWLSFFGNQWLANMLSHLGDSCTACWEFLTGERSLGGSSSIDWGSCFGVAIFIVVILVVILIVAQAH